MIRKLLLLVKLLFTTISTEKTFIPSMKLICLGMFFVASFSFGQTRTWTGATSSNWNTASNWTPASVPTNVNDVVILNTTNKPIISIAGAECANLTINNTGTNSNVLTINSPGTLNVTGAITISAPTGTGTKNSVLNVSNGILTAASISMSDSGSDTRDSEILITSGIVNISGNIVMAGNSNRNDITFSSTGIINIAGTITGGTLIPSTGTVNYNRSGNQTVGSYTYNNLTLSGSGTKTTTGVIVNSVLSMEGTATASVAPTYGGSATLQYNTASSRNTGVEWVTPFTGTGGVIINNSGTITLNGAKVFNTSIPLTINSGATLATANNALTFGGNFTNSGTFTSGSSITISGTGTQNISGFTTTGSVSVNKTGGMATLNSAVTGGNFTIAPGPYLNLGTTASIHTANTLTLGATQVLPGSYGGTTSAATNINTSYFASGLGIINVATSTCSNFSTVALTTNVSFNTLNKTTTLANAYHDYTTDTPTSVYKTQYYALTVKGNTGGDANGYYSAFFDWNNDGDFDDANEYYQIGSIRNSSGGDAKVASVYIQIPSTSVTGNIKMRVIGRIGGYNATPCAVSGSTGQMQDYTLTILSGCTGSLATTTTNSNASTVCPNVPFTLSLGSTYSDGVTYLWETSPTGNAPWTSAATPSIAFFNSDFSTNQASNTKVGNIAIYGGNDTQITAGAVVLTDKDLDGHNGGFLIDKANADNITPFTATFKYRIQDGGNVGADGMSLSYGDNLPATPGGGESGEGSGLIIQFDTYDNEGVADGSRIRVLYNNTSLFNTAINAPFNLRTATFRNVNLYVDTDGYLTLSIENSVGTMITVVSKLLLPGYAAANKSTWKFKFSARTGGSKDKHSIDDLVITYLDSANSKSKFTTSQTTKTYYRATVTCGSSSVVSTPVLVDMTSAVITTQPTAPAAVCSGAGVRTITVAATGSGLTYSWRRAGVALSNGGVISGQGTNTLTLTNPLAANAGNYDVVITGACSSTATSNAVAVVVNALPTPTFSPLSGTSTCVGTTVTYTTQLGMSNYVWGLPGVAVTDYTIAGGGTSADNYVSLIYKTIGSKTVTVNYTNGNGCTATSASSSPAITVNALPVISQQPLPLPLCEGQNGSFTITTSASSPTYQWEYSTSASGPWALTNGAAGVSGHNTASLSLTNVPVTYSGYYVRCTVTSNTCSTISNQVLLTVNPLPTTPTAGTPTDVTCTNTGSVTLTNLPSGSWTLVRNPGTVATTGSGNTYTVTGLAVGTYTFAVSNGSCSSATSPNVVIADNSSTTWNGSWSKGAPDATKAAIINAAFTVSSDLTACSLTINPGIAISVPSSRTLNIVNELTVSPTASLTFENNSSLVQVNNNAVNSGNITYKRIAPQIRRGDFVYWSTPVSPQKLVDVSSLTLADKYMGYSGTNWVVTNKNSNMIVGKGYIIRGPQTYSTTVKQDYPAEFKGVPNNGIVAGETLLNNKYYLIGNPYPSALDAKKFLDDNATLLKGTLYFWTHNTGVTLVGAYKYTSDDYATYNLTGSTVVREPAISGNTPGNTPVAPSGYIGAGQSFFALSKSAGTVTFNNGMRLGAANNTQFFKSASKQTDYEKHRVWLNITNTEGAFKQMLVGYVEGATNEYEDRYDGGSFSANPYIDFYSIGNGKKYTIQGRALPFTNTDEVPLGYSTTITGNFTIEIDQADGDLANQAIYLEDKTTGIIHDLKASNYTFATEKGTFADRFILRYTNKTLGTGDFENTENGLVVSVKEKTIKVISSQENIKEVTIFDVTGKLLYNKKKVGNTELQIQNLPSANQVLLVKVTLENDFTTTKKIIFN